METYQEEEPVATSHKQARGAEVADFVEKRRGKQSEALFDSAPTNHVTAKGAQSNVEYRRKSVCIDRYIGVSLSGPITGYIGRNAIHIL